MSLLWFIAGRGGNSPHSIHIQLNFLWKCIFSHKVLSPAENVKLEMIREPLTVYLHTGKSGKECFQIRKILIILVRVDNHCKALEKYAIQEAILDRIFFMIPTEIRVLKKCYIIFCSIITDVLQMYFFIIFTCLSETQRCQSNPS